jgi:16S rRNA (guanine(1405)-N(7))-methyltransferase
MTDYPGLDVLIAQITDSKKYRAIGLCDDTVRDILLTELARHKNPKEAVQAAKKKLHEVMGLYLGDPNYAQAQDDLTAAFASDDPGAIRAICIDLLRTHDSTRERLPLLDEFYPRLFEVTGVPQVVIDVASGLHPLALPWMGLPQGAHYDAYEIHQQRVDLLNHFFALCQPRYGVAATAYMQDILVHPPAVSADVVFLFKEIHRMEKRRRGSVLPLLDALDTHWLALSLPSRSLSGRHPMIESNRGLVKEILGDRPWPITEITLDSEQIFCINKRS